MEIKLYCQMFNEAQQNHINKFRYHSVRKSHFIVKTSRFEYGEINVYLSQIGAIDF